MASIFTLENINDFSEKLNLDELYERKKQHDLNKLELFNKILNRIHVRIKTTSRQKIDEQFCWFVVPETILGVPKYDQGACIAYLLDKLQTNGFRVRYIHPNTLFICWNHFVPSYIRNELKKKTGIVVDEYGNRISEDETESSSSSQNNNVHSLMIQSKEKKLNTRSQKEEQNKKNFTPINVYKPQGNFIYDDEIIHLLEEKL
jgi:Family of unknown function (DUF5759)